MSQLDVRELMSKGGEPFAVIMEAVAHLGEAESFELLAPLDPVPLYAVLGARGYDHRTEELGGGDYRVVFTPLPEARDGAPE